MTGTARPWALPVGVLLASALAALLAAAPVMGTDLAAAVARADFWRDAGTAPVDLRWYAGTTQWAYSLGSQVVVAALGARTTLLAAAWLTTVASALLLVRTGARRPVLGTVAVAAGAFGNAASGRVAYALGLALGASAVLALTVPRPRWARLLAALGALLATAASPVAGLFVGLVGAALLLTGRRGDGLALAGPAALVLAAVALLFGEGGTNTMSGTDTWHAVVLSLAVTVFAGPPVVRVAGLLSAAGNLGAFLVATPVGLNATRLAVGLGVAAVVATARRGATVLLAVVVAMLAVQLPVMTGDVARRGDPVAAAEWSQGLLDELDRRGVTGRVEVPPTRHYWEAAHVAREVPLARGWLRQRDRERHPLFFAGRLTPERYLAWLREEGVQWVALPEAPGVEPSWVAAQEVALLRAGLSGLQEVWRDARWRLFAVTGSPGLTTARVVSLEPHRLRLRVDAPGEHLVRVAPSRWLALEGPGCLRDAGRWVVVRAQRAGELVLTSRLLGERRRCP